MTHFASKSPAIAIAGFSFAHPTQVGRLAASTDSIEPLNRLIRL
jgi:hypothetical protein